ncbi:MAG: stage II sporulation protein D [Clostridia bacterium]|nr:stage II sporulation protein D [Clostridia bacterium]
MKKYFIILTLLCAMLVLTPLLSVQYIKYEKEEPAAETDSSEKNDTIKVMLNSTGFIKEMDIREYLIGSVAGEMPANYHSEALKAQAVVSFTFAQYIRRRDGEKLGGADISDDSSVYQSYIDEEKRKAKWKDDFEKNEKIVADAVDAVLGEYLEYGGEPAMAVYFDKSCGRTESCENVWGKSVPYLVSVTSDGDKLAPDVQSEAEFTDKELKTAFEKAQIEYKNSADTPIDGIERFDSGVVKTVSVGKKEISGTRFREILSLKSAYFNVKKTDKGYKITCFGNGHFVGMSQYGADFMARQGSSYKEILSHYYPGTEIRNF